MKGRLGDLLIGFFVVAIAGLFLMPLPTLVLDLLIVFNLGASVLLLLVVLFVSEPSKLFVFPAVLLVSTLFRLGLNVASTRLILLDGYAGDVIQSFGQFLISGEVIVGVVIFSIITVVNYIVVAKGASRVAEVAARFTLDGLPVKQMAIESDMRAGLLTNQEAMNKREELRRESQLYGSMDGAMKFIQGDVIAGILIIFTNIFGGLYIGLSSGLSFADAAQTYTILTVGDGLVSQIPSLLGAFCAGVVVTRVSAGTGQTLSGEIFEQIMMRKEAWLISGGIMILIALAPGTPLLPFSLAGLVFISLAYLLPRRMASSLAGSAGGSFSIPGGEQPRLLPTSATRSGAQTRFSLELEERLFSGASHDEQKISLQIWADIQRNILKERGVSLPDIKISFVGNRPHGSFFFFQDTYEIMSGRIPSDARFVSMRPSAAALFGLTVSQEGNSPYTGFKGAWINYNRQAGLILEAGGINAQSQLEYVLNSCAYILLNNPEKIISVADCFSLVKSLSSQDPGLIAHLIDSGLVSVPKLAQILQALVREGFYVGNLRNILEDLASFFSKFDQPAETPFVVDELIGAIRKRRQREVLGQAMSLRGGFRAIYLGPNLKSEIQQAMARGDMSYLLRNRELMTKLMSNLDHLFSYIGTKGILPVGICCEEEERPVLREMFIGSIRSFPIVSLDEIESDYSVEELGVWEI
jgi:type III secretory pathway component EscV